jgi:hypothetical protein
MKRRDFVKALIAGTLAPCCNAHAWGWAGGYPQQAGPYPNNPYWWWNKAGCSLSFDQAHSFGLNGPRLIASSGDRYLDQGMMIECRKLASLFGVAPGFALFDDSQGANAFATPETIVPNGRGGSVLFGYNLLRNEYKKYRESAIIGVMAHEWGHIFQYANGLQGKQGRPMELHADFLAGWYMAAKMNRQADPRAVFASLYEKGDYNFNSPQHHGMPEERIQAGVAGYEAYQRGAASARQAFQIGARWVGL